MRTSREIQPNPDIRDAAPADAARLVEIYRPYVETSAVSFELRAPTTVEFARRIEQALLGWAWLVASVDDEVAGYAYGSTHRSREAYRWSVETSVYLDRRFFRRGLGRALYVRLLDRLASRGFGNVYAGVTLPNDASVALHASLGFEPIGVFPRVGRKFGRWHDVAWLHRPLHTSVDDSAG